MRIGIGESTINITTNVEILKQCFLSCHVIRNMTEVKQNWGGGGGKERIGMVKNIFNNITNINI